MKTSVTRLDDCPYLLVSQITDPLTHFADHGEPCSHDAINRYVRGEWITPRLVWENVRGHVVPAPRGSVLCDDTVLDQHASFAIDLVRRQYSGHAQAVLKGVGVVPCVYVHPALDRFWLLDSRLDDPDGEGQSKHAHGRAMLAPIVDQQHLPFAAVWMDTWYATRDLMLCMESLQQFSSYPLTDHRQVEDSGGPRLYRRVDALVWSTEALAHGKTIKIGLTQEPS